MKRQTQLSPNLTETINANLAAESTMSRKNAPIEEEEKMMSCFAVFPDGAAAPTAVFADLEDAMDWGLERYGGDAFGIRYLDLTQVESAERRGAPGPV
jgi:hypothetical protein